MVNYGANKINSLCSKAPQTGNRLILTLEFTCS